MPPLPMDHSCRLRQAWYPPSRSVTFVNPRPARVAAARLDAYPSSHTMITRLSGFSIAGSRWTQLLDPNAIPGHCVDDHRAFQIPIALAELFGTDVNNQCASEHLFPQVDGLHTWGTAGASVGQQSFDCRDVGHL